jgi:hypothetical protein
VVDLGIDDMLLVGSRAPEEIQHKMLRKAKEGGP